MRASELDLRELLSFEPGGGVIRFGGQRVLLFDAVALGLLRRELIDVLGLTAAGGISYPQRGQRSRWQPLTMGQPPQDVSASDGSNSKPHIPHFISADLMP